MPHAANTSRPTPSPSHAVATGDWPRFPPTHTQCPVKSGVLPTAFPTLRSSLRKHMSWSVGSSVHFSTSCCALCPCRAILPPSAAVAILTSRPSPSKAPKFELVHQASSLARDGLRQHSDRLLSPGIPMIPSRSAR